MEWVLKSVTLVTAAERAESVKVILYTVVFGYPRGQSLGSDPCILNLRVLYSSFQKSQHLHIIYIILP